MCDILFRWNLNKHDMSMKNYNPGFGILVKEKRIQLGLTQSQLSETVGICLRTINLIENDGHIPRQNNIKKLKKCLDIQDAGLDTCDTDNVIRPVRCGNRNIVKLAVHLEEGRDIRYLLQGMFDARATGVITLKDILWMLEIEKQIGVPISEETANKIFAEKKS